MVSALDSGASAPGSSPGRRHGVVFLGKTLYSHMKVDVGQNVRLVVSVRMAFLRFVVSSCRFVSSLWRFVVSVHRYS